MLFCTLFFYVGLNLLELTHSSMKDPEIQAKIKLNLLLNQVYTSAKIPTSFNQPDSKLLTYAAAENLTSYELKQLNEVIEITNKPPDITCDETKLVVTGILIKTSDLVDSLDCDGSLPPLIEIFAADTILIDEDLDMSGYHGLLSIFAPMWAVQGKRRITVNGITPPDIDPPKASDGQNSGSGGYNGIPGSQGNTAGSIFGLGILFHNGEDLEISASGSDGGKGQDGGDGKNGRDGNNGDVKNTKYECSKSWFTWTCKGEDGQKGGNGGDGGVGGYPGLPGEIELINGESITQVIENGTVGNPGVGGNEGNGGKKGDTYKGVHVIWWFDVHKSETVTTRAANGVVGQNGTNEKDIEFPETTVKIASRAEEIINDYKTFIEDNLENEFLRQQEYDFLIQLMNTEEFEKFYTTKGVITEFTSLEEHFDSLFENVDFLPLYQALLDHILAVPVTNDENRKVLAYLYTTTLSKICALQDQTTKNFITDLKTFLDVCIDNIKELEESKTAVIIGQYSTVYKNDIDEVIDEAGTLIDQHIVPKIKETTTNIDNNIKQLSEEIAELQHQAEMHQKELEAAKKRMKSNIIGSIFGGILKGVGQVLSFFPTLGIASTICIGAGSQIGAFFDKEGNKIPELEKFVDLKEQYLGIVNVAEERTKRVIVEFRSQLFNIKSLLTSETNFLQSDVEELDQKVLAWSGNEDELLKIYIQGLEDMMTKLSEPDLGRGIVDKLNSTLYTAMNYSKQAAPVITTAYDIYKSIQHNKDQVNSISQAIEENKKTIELLKNYQVQVEETLIPMLNEVGKTLNYIQNNLNDASAAKLEVTKWEVQNTLTNVKQILQEFTEGFEVQTELVNSIDIIIDAINTMINVYDKIVNFKNQKELADYIANVNSAAYINIPVQDSELSNALNKLELALKSNVVLQKYRESITQIKQLAFPLAQNYFTETNLPQALQMESTFETYTQNAVNQLKRFQTKVYDSSIYISKFDDIKHRSKFYDISTAGPFIVWPNQTHYNPIMELLKGEEVIFYADPNMQQKNAVKFNLIDLRFVSPTYQQQLDDILTNYEAVLTHMGNSYYNCNNKTYVVTTGSQKFQTSFQKISDKPADVNLVFQKIYEGDFLLSPYTTWKIQLVNVTTESFDLLVAYGQGSDLHLVGRGEFFEYSLDLCSQNLEKYYKVEDVAAMKEDECVKVLSEGAYHQNHTCYVNFGINVERLG